MTLVLLLVAASRIPRLDVWDMQPSLDEVWSIWQTFGSLGDVIRWTPYDWPPGYYVTLWGWQQLVGIHPVAIRMLSVCAMLVGTAGLYRAAGTLGGRRAGVLAALAYSAFGYVIFLSIELRGYALLLGLMPLALWQTMRYFDAPSVRRGAVLGILIAAMLYVSLTSAAAMGMIGLFTLVVWRRAVWRWLLPVTMAGLLYLPEILNKLPLVRGRVDALNDVALPAEAALATLYQTYFGNGALVWALLFAIATLTLVLRRRRQTALSWALALWVLMPFVLFATHRYFGFFQARYGWWVLPGLALWLGIGLARLPRIASVSAAVVVTALMFLPLPLGDYQIRPTGLARAFAQLRENARWGDVVLVDPNCRCLDAAETDYYTRVYFPDGLRFVPEPADHKRVWYVANWQLSPALASELETTRASGIGFGPSRHFFRLYEAPPSAEGVVFENGMVFHGVDFPGKEGVIAAHEGESIKVRLWWSAEQPILRDYSAGLYLMTSSGDVVAQVDGPPGMGSLPETSAWQRDQLYVEERAISVPYPAAIGNLRLRLGVYHWADPERVNAPGVFDERLLPVGQISVMAW